MKEKIAIITNIPSPYRVDLFNYLHKILNYEITVIYATHNEDNRDWRADINIKHKLIFLKSKTIKIRKQTDYKYIHIPFNIKATLNKIWPDIVIGSEYNLTVINAFKWCKKNNKKYISWSDGTLSTEKNINLIQRIFRKMICKKSDALIASSTKTKEAQLYYGADEKKIYISYLTIDINKYIVKEKKYRSNTLLYTGRLVKGKGLDLLFNSLISLKSDFLLNIVGNGPEEDELRKLANELGISDKIVFCGFKSQNQIIDYYKEADIFILPTRQDCFGLVITEAMCAALPVIASKYADGVYDLINEGKNGFIIDPYNSVELKEKIEYLLLNPEEIKRMGKFSLEKAANFSIEKVSREFINGINSII